MGSGGRGGREAARSMDAFRDRQPTGQLTGQPSEQPTGQPTGQPRGAADRSRLPPRHCWVLNPPSAPGRWPGLVVEWRSVAGHWEGRVVVVLGRGRDAAVLDVWMREEQLTPL
jgi:hypothetical protein